MLFLVVAFFFIYIESSGEIEISYLITFTVMFIISIFLFLLSVYFYKTYKVLGNISFESEHILLLDDKIMLTDVKFIEIRYKRIFSRSLIGIVKEEGDDNIIYIGLINGESYDYRFLLKKKAELVYLKNVAEEYKNQGISINIKK